MTIFAFLMLGTLATNAQSYELGGFAGVTNYSGDLHPTHMESGEYNIAYGLFGRLNMNRHFSAKISLTAGQISGTDRNSEASNGRRKRNLEFHSNIYELAVTGEYNFIPYDLRKNHFAAFYAFGGLAGFYFNPTADYDGERYNLRDLGTEGQYLEGSSIKPYSRFQIAIPMGLGTKFNLNDKSNIGLEFGFRKTFTDYLDDVSSVYPDMEALGEANPIAAALSYREADYFEVTQKSLGNPEGQIRGNSNKKDWYFFMGATLSVNLSSRSDIQYTNKFKYFELAF